jgi:hypothetical protein
MKQQEREYGTAIVVDQAWSVFIANGPTTAVDAVLD